MLYHWRDGVSAPSSGQMFSAPKPRKAQQAGPAVEGVKQRGHTDRYKKNPTTASDTVLRGN